ncbi:acetylornithine transaminase [Alkalicoccus saliphilus]|uniref:Acetylornithine aminotransferase n=1 Tax=Alkalicoccus saliphilus TaxID=200989 RepID=A0A2T4U849_9BACI|nr:acetylornithine transaminase [Alkalicoccus saliphilus]PTL39564.1 acetylornithine transaminase [Alkalicoccus saliphilus]
MPETAAVTSHVMETYSRFPITVTKGEGSWLWDDKDNAYLDFTSGIATCNLGHVPFEVKKAVQEQSEKLWHCSNLYHIPQQEKAASLLAHGGLNKAFFCNSGAEANEAAWKLARKYMHDRSQSEKKEIITFSQSFHGRTGGAMSATAQEKVHYGFAPLMPGFSYLPYNDIHSLNSIDPGSTAAVMLELVQGEGGVIPAQEEWITKLTEFCRENDILLIVDEIQTGAGRTGTFTASEQYGIEPDILTLAKGIGSGFPVGVMLSTEKVGSSFSPGTHGSTFGGNPLAMAALCATVETVNQPKFLEEVRDKAAFFHSSLEKVLEEENVEIRGRGMLIGIDFNRPAAPLITELRNNSILALPAGENVLRVLPPLTVDKKELEKFTTGLSKALEKVKKGAWKK